MALLSNNKSSKLYYSIKEVANMLQINRSTLRFWEKEFDIIHPRTIPNGTRFYTKEDIEAIRLVYHLVKERGLTLQGAKQKIKDNKEGVEQHSEIVHRLKEIKQELNGIIDALDEIENVENS